MIYLLTFSALISGILYIRAKYSVLKYQLVIFKPITMLLIISIAFLYPAIDLNYKIFIIAGLLFSLVGDMFLIFPEKHFTKGLISFLIGHILYIFAFVVLAGFHITIWIFLPIVLLSILYLKTILPHTGNKTLPVIIYVIIITMMGWIALERLYYLQNLGSLLAAIGACLFMISDSVLALNKFRKSFHRAELIILSTYYTAQWLLTVSIIIQ
jgi:uncharacterized membrane protein YhhN